MPDREDRFAMLGDLLEAALPRRDALVVDLGIGPGSLAHRLLTRFPDIEVVGVDADPLLLALAEGAWDGGRLRTVRADLRDPGWFEALELARRPDAFVSSTALHWINREPLRELLEVCGRQIARGGVFIDADHLYEGRRGPRLDQILRAITARRLVGVRESRQEDWEAWWTAVDTAPELADAVAERAGGFDHPVTDRPSVHDYLSSLSGAGFEEAGIAWQVGDDRIIVGLADAGH